MDTTYWMPVKSWIFEKSIGMYKDNNADAQINKDKDYNYKLSLVESGVNTYGCLSL